MEYRLAEKPRISRRRFENSDCLSTSTVGIEMKFLGEIRQSLHPCGRNGRRRFGYATGWGLGVPGDEGA